MINKVLNFLFQVFLLERVKNVVENILNQYVVNGKKENLIIGKNVKIGSRVEFECYSGKIYIGDDSVIMSDVKIMCYGGDITIGNNVSINSFSILYGHGSLTIGNYVRIANSTIIIPSNHNYSDLSIPIYQQGETSLGVSIEDDVWLGTNVKILDNVKIGKGNIIGAGSVVNKSLEGKYKIYAGVPARFIKNRNNEKDSN